MVKQSILDEYKKAKISTATQSQLIIMLYDGAIKFINLAKEALKLKKYDVVNNNLIKAQEVIIELMVSLNFDAGEVAEKLYSIYMYIHRRLVEANIGKKEEPLNEVLKFLSDLRETWNKISESYDETPQKIETGLNLTG